MPRIPLSHLTLIVFAGLLVSGCTTADDYPMDSYVTHSKGIPLLRELHRVALAAVRRDKPIHHPSSRFDDMEFYLGTSKRGPIVYIQSLEYLHQGSGQIWAVEFGRDFSTVLHVNTMGVGGSSSAKLSSAKLRRNNRR